MEKKKGKYTNGHSEKEKAEILIILARNNYNYYKTSKETGVCRPTLKRWHESDEFVCRKIREMSAPVESRAIPNLIENPTVSEALAAEVVAPLKTARQDFLEVAAKVRMDGLERLEMLMASEKDMFKIIAAIKTITDIMGESIPADSPKGNFFWQINQQIINNQELIKNNDGNSRVNPKGDKQE